MMEKNILMEKMRLFLNRVHVDKDKEYAIMNFSSLGPELAKEVRNNPEEFFGFLMSETLRKISGLKKNIYIIFKNVPNSYKTKIEDISSQHLGKFIQVEGKIEKKTAVITKISKCKYECPSCGNILAVLMSEENNKLLRPTRCGCGRVGHFREVSRTYEDSFDLIVSEEEYLLRIMMGEPFLNSEFKTILKKDKSIIISGYVVSMAKRLPHGSESTEIEKVLIANSIQKVK